MVKFIKVLVKRSRLQGGSFSYFVIPTNPLLKTVKHER
jgi:hypothetical protein